VGRALALLGFEVRRGVASREEVERGARKASAAAPARPAAKSAAPPDRPATEPPAPAAEQSPDLDARILRAAEELGYDAAKVRKWVNQKYEVTGGLDSLTPHDKREVLKIFEQQSGRTQTKAARK
jgi:pyruvate/2-oxoglutarate dehydrogenase complex dihydrolipoamide acyltransferase (E2) component